MAIASAAEGYFAWLMPVVLCMFMYIIPFFFLFFCGLCRSAGSMYILLFYMLCEDWNRCSWSRWP